MNYYGEYNLIHSVPTEIYLGSDPDDYFFEDIQKFGVILNFTDKPGHPTERGNIVLHYSMDDIELEQVVPNKKDSEDFLLAAHMLIMDRKSLWHCHAGLNRSSFMLAAYLHLHRNFDIGDAIHLIQKRRSDIALCNNTFKKVLFDRYG